MLLLTCLLVVSVKWGDSTSSVARPLLLTNPTNQTADGEIEGAGEDQQGIEKVAIHDYQGGAESNVYTCNDRKLLSTVCVQAAVLAGRALADINNAQSVHNLQFVEIVKLRTQAVEGAGYDLCLKVNETISHVQEYIHIRMFVPVDDANSTVIAQANMQQDGQAMSAEIVGSIAEQVNQHLAKKHMITDDEHASFPCHAGIEHEPAFVGQYPTGYISSVPASIRPRLAVTLKQLTELGYKTDNLPETYNVGDEFPTCIEPVGAQGLCGSCYVFAATHAASERTCIHKEKLRRAGKISRQEPFRNIPLSKQVVVSCGQSANQNPSGDKMCVAPKGRGYGHGCDGGDPYSTFFFMSNEGNPEESCVRYQQTGNSVNHFSETSGVVACEEVTKPACFANSSLLTVGQFYNGGLLNDEQTIKAMVYEGGPVVVAFDTPPSLQRFDFTRGQVFTTQSKENIGGHAVVVHGWGTNHEGVKYWLLKNSWGTRWGDKGYFRFLRGVNLLGIEDSGSFINLDSNGPDCPRSKCVHSKVAQSGGVIGTTVVNVCDSAVHFDMMCYGNGGNNGANCGMFTYFSITLRKGGSRTFRKCFATCAVGEVCKSSSSNTVPCVQTRANTANVPTLRPTAPAAEGDRSDRQDRPPTVHPRPVPTIHPRPAPIIPPQDNFPPFFNDPNAIIFDYYGLTTDPGPLLAHAHA